MKKLLGISLVAVLAATPLMAMADPVSSLTAADYVSGTPAHIDVVADSQADGVITASGAPKYALVEANEGTDGNAATAGYVKGAYNAAIKAINKVSETANSAVQEVTEGTADGTIRVDGTDVAVHGLGSSAFVDTGDLAGTAGTYSNSTSGMTATTIQGAIDEVEGRVDTAEGKIGNATLATTDKTLTGAINELNTTVTNLDNTYATEAEVTANINAATGSVTLTDQTALTVAGTPTGTIANTFTPGSVTIALMDDWSHPNTPGTGVTANVTGASITSDFTGTGIAGGKATGSIENIDVAAPAQFARS